MERSNEFVTVLLRRGSVRIPWASRQELLECWCQPLASWSPEPPSEERRRQLRRSGGRGIAVDFSGFPERVRRVVRAFEDVGTSQPVRLDDDEKDTLLSIVWFWLEQVGV